MAKGKTKRRKTRKGTIKRYLRKAKSKKLWPYAHKGGHRAAMGKAAGSAGLTRHDWARGLGRRGGKRAHGKRVKRFRVLARADRYGYRIAANKRRRGGKQRRVYDNIVTDNPRRKRRGSRRGYRRVRHNLGIITDNPFVDSIKEVFTMDTLVEAGQVTLGSLAAVVIPNLLYSIPAVGNVVPAALKSGWGSYLVNLLATGAASGVASYMGKSKLARNLLIGGVSGTMTKIVMEQLVPKLPAEVQARTGLKGYGLGILTADMEAAVEQAVSTELARQGVSGMEDYLVPGEAGTPQLGGLDDYLVPVEASIPQLAGFGDDDAQEVEFF